MPVDFISSSARLDGASMRGRGRDGSVVLQSRRLPRWLYELVATELPRTSPAYSYERVEGDKIILVSVAEGAYQDFEIEVNVLHGSRREPVALSLYSGEGVATFDGKTLRQKENLFGNAVVRGTSASRIEDVTVSFSPPGDLTTETIIGGVSGSLREAATVAVDSRIAGKFAGVAKPIYSASNPIPPGTYARNSSFWAADVDLTCIPAYDSVNGIAPGGVAISPRHYLTAAHVAGNFGPGVSIRFVTPDNQTVTRTITAGAYHPQYGGGNPSYYADFWVGLLDSDLPASITPARVLPDSLYDYLPDPGEGVPILQVNQSHHAGVLDLETLGNPSDFLSLQPPTDLKRKEFETAVASGDSGKAAFMLIGNEAFLTNVTTFAGGGGSAIHLFLDSLDAMMTALGGGYTLSRAYLSGYRTGF